jgi:hypothetical protein
MQCPSISHSYGTVGTLCLWIREETAEETAMAAITILHKIFDAFVSYRMRQAAAEAEQVRPRASSQPIGAS